MNNLYLNTAKLYDSDNRAIFSDDIPFYLNWAQHLGGKVLELACGTGRITIPLAKAGVDIVGLDYSNTMLDVLDTKVTHLPADIQRLIHFVHGDMTSFTLDETFKLIFIPFRSFQSLETDAQALSCLKSVHQHLEQDGRFIINVFKPYREIGEWWLNTTEKLDFESTLDNGDKITRHSIKKAYDINKRLLTTKLVYRVHHEDVQIEEHHDYIQLRYYYGDELRAMIEHAGFKIDEEYGWYDGTSVSEGNEFIFICSKI